MSRGADEVQLPEDLRYGPEHEWSRIDADGSVTIGITDFAQDQLGDVEFLDLPEVGATLTRGEPMAEVESTKAASDIFAPVSGEVIEVNSDLVAQPKKINSDPYGAWLVRVRPSDPAELDTLISAAEYQRSLE